MYFSLFFYINSLEIFEQKFVAKRKDNIVLYAYTFLRSSLAHDL